MLLNYIKSQGVKGRTIEAALKAITIIYGPNATGKTALADALRILLTGTNHRATKAIRIEGGIIRDNGEAAILVREWTESRGGTVKAAHQVPDGFGETPRVLLEPRFYLGKTPKERAKYVTGLMDLSNGGMTGAEIVTEVSGLVFETPTNENVRALADFATELRESDEERHNNHEPVQDWLETWLGLMPGRIKAAKDALKGLQTYASGQARLQATDDVEPTRNVDAELQDANSRLGGQNQKIRDLVLTAKAVLRAEVTKDIAALEAAEIVIHDMVEVYQAKTIDPMEFAACAKIVENSVERLDQLDRAHKASVAAIESARQRIDSRKALNERLEKNEALALELKGQIEANSSGPVLPMPPQHVSRVQECDTKVNTARQSHNTAKNEYARLSAKLTDIAAQIAELQGYQCPCCQQIGAACKNANDKIKKLLDYDKQTRSDLSDVQADVLKKQTEYDAAYLDKCKANDEDKAAVKLQNEYGAYLALWTQTNVMRDRFADVQRSLEFDKKEIAKYAHVDDEWRLAENDKAACLADMKVIADARSKYDRCKADSKQLAEYQNAVVVINDLRPMINERAALELQVATLNAMQKRHAAAQLEETRLTQTKQAEKDAEGKLEALILAGAKLTEMQGKLISETFGKLLTTINACTAGLIPEPIEYDSGEIGRRVNGAWVSHEEFSGFEQAVTYMGVSAALAQDAPIRAVIIDDLIISDQNKHKLMTRALQLVGSKVIDQLFIVDVKPDVYREFITHKSQLVGECEIG